MYTVLVVTRKDDDYELVARSLGPDYRADRAVSGDDALEHLSSRHHFLVYIDIDILLEMSPSQDLQQISVLQTAQYPSSDLVVMVPADRIRQAITILKAGATNYITYPPNPDEVRLVARTAVSSSLKNLELKYLRDQFWQSESRELVHTENAAMQDVFKRIQSVARTKATVMLAGETGTGKGVVARLIHQHSNRRNEQFISVHCGAIPDTLLESELFGHEKGAFTGAHRKKLGKFEIARGGTIFLDEVGTITAASQIKLLQVLQDGTFSRVGGEETIETNARIITASNADLKKMSENGTFRRDLYYRLNVFPIYLPPLRERKEDISFLTMVFLKKFNREYGKSITTVHPQVLIMLMNYSWPGNIRELENLVERANILEHSTVLTPGSFPEELFGTGGSETSAVPLSAHTTLAEARRTVVENFEQQYLKALFAHNRGKVKKSAAEAGITPRQLNKLMLKYDIRKEDFKV